jgi:hypothetical protein
VNLLSSTSSTGFLVDISSEPDGISLKETNYAF